MNLNAALADCRLKVTGDLVVATTGDPTDVRDEAAFARCRDTVRADVADRMQSVVRTAARALGRHAEVRRTLEGLPASEARADIEAQLDNLVFDGFVSATPEPHFGRLERYLHAAEVRLAGLRTNPARDRLNLDVIAELEEAYARVCERYPVGELPPAASDVGWLLEELRVSLFAQSLGTAQPVSAKRVRSALASLG